MDRCYTTTIEPIILGGIEKQIEYFRNIGILKSNLEAFEQIVFWKI